MSEEAQEIAKEITEEIFNNCIRCVTMGHSVSGILAMDEVLETVLGQVDHNIDLREEYENNCRSHNQYELFNMLDIINGFEIDRAKYEALVFRETLMVSKLETRDGCLLPVPVGGICFDVQQAEGRQPMERMMDEYETKLLRTLNEERATDPMEGGSKYDLPTNEPPLDTQNQHGYSKFLVHVASQFGVADRNGGSNITTWVDRNLHTLEELRKEFLVSLEGSVSEKTLFMAMKKKWYYVKTTCSAEEIEEKKLYSFAKARDYISEGANIVLLRYLAISKYYGKFELSSAYINGDLCRNIYVTHKECFGPESGVLNNRKLDICMVQRTIIEECGIVHKCISVMTIQGQLLKQEWQHCDYVLHINPKAIVENVKPTCSDQLPLADFWENDLQLTSRYLDQELVCKMLNKSYMLDHPEIKNIIADYVNKILLMRPKDVLNFTQAYFGEFSAKKLPLSDYFQ